MTKFACILLAVCLGVAAASPQRNLNYPTTKRPGQPGQPNTPTTAAPTATTPQSAPYAPAGFRPGRAFNLPTEERKAQPEPSPSYGPPADKYGPPEDATTTVQPEFDEVSTDASSRIPNDLKPGFYFIQLPGGGIQKVALLTNAALVEQPLEVVAAAEDAAEQNPTATPSEDAEPVTEPTTAATPTSSGHVQPVAKTQRTVEVWPQAAAVPAIVAGNAKLVAAPVRSQQIVAIEPILLVEPKSYAYTSQFRSW